MAMFGGFKPSGMQKIADTMGYGKLEEGEAGLKSFKDYVAQDPTRQSAMNKYVNKAISMANGGAVSYGSDQVANDLSTYDPNNPNSPFGRTIDSPAVLPTYTPPPQQKFPTIDLNVPATGVNPNTTGAATIPVPSSTNLYRPEYLDPRTGQVSPTLLGGGPGDRSGTSNYSIASNIPDADLQQRLRLRNAGYAGEWGSGDAAKFTPATTINPIYKNDPSLLGGNFTDINTIPEEQLKQRYRLRQAGYTKGWGSGEANDFVASKSAKPGFRNLAPEFLNAEGTAIRSDLQGGSLDKQTASGITSDILRQRLQLRNAGYQAPWGSGQVGEWLKGGGNRQDWEQAGQNLTLSAPKTYGGLTLGDAPAYQVPGSLGDAPDVFLPTINERDYTQQEITQGKPTLHQKLRSAFGYTGTFGEGEFGTFFGEYLKNNPGAQEIHDSLINEYETGSLNVAQQKGIEGLAEGRFQSPALPTGTAIETAYIPLGNGQFVDPNTGQLVNNVTAANTQAISDQAAATTAVAATQAGTTLASPAVSTAATALDAQQMSVSDASTVQGQSLTASAVSNVEAAQAEGIIINSPVQQQVQSGQLVDQVANAATAAAYTEQIQAANASPTTQATVQGQIEQLTEDFSTTNPPPWAAGAIRAANEMLARRGLGSSSMAGQAVIQATLEAAIPIAQADASILAQFEVQNLSNNQQRAMLSAQQRAAFLGQDFDQNFQARVQNAARISDVANSNFTAEQQVQLENSNIANTINLQNLSNKQALLLSEASALAGLDSQNLSNSQQAAVQNAQSFLQKDLTDVNNAQQTELFKTQQIIQSLFTDQAAVNAAAQFNASSDNQVTQFFSGLDQQTKQFNAAQNTAINQFNAGEDNTTSKFNAEIQNQREQFNSQNRLVIDQANAVWRRQVATADTAAVNRSNEVNATNLLDISNSSYNDLWQLYDDQLEYAHTSGENVADRAAALVRAEMSRDTSFKIAEENANGELGSAIGSSIVKVITSPAAGTLLGKFFNFK